MNTDQQASDLKKEKPAPYWTIAAVTGEPNHISGLLLRQRRKGRNHISLDFDRDPEKAMKFADQKAADSMLTTLRMFAPSYMSEYRPMKHQP